MNELNSVQTDESQEQPTEALNQEKQEAGETPAEPEESKPGKDDEIEKIVQDKIKKRIARFTAKEYALKEQLRQERLKNQDLNKKPEFPNPKQFEDDYGNLKQKEWSEAVSRYEDDKDNWKSAQHSTKQDEEQIKNDLIEGQARFMQNGAELSRKNPDFFQVISQQNVYSVPLANTLFTLDNGHELAYYLGKHKDEALRIGSLDSDSMIDELESLEKRMKVQSKSVSNAPKPIVPIDGGDVEIKDINSITDDQEWFEARKREKLRKLQKG
jgi:hypothetical protein